MTEEEEEDGTEFCKLILSGELLENDGPALIGRCWQIDCCVQHDSILSTDLWGTTSGVERFDETFC